MNQRYATIQVGLLEDNWSFVAVIIFPHIGLVPVLPSFGSSNLQVTSLLRALICYLHNPKFFFIEIPQGPLGISIGTIRSAQKAFRVPQSSVFCHFPCFVEISPKNGICSQNCIFWPIFKCHTILESYRQHGRRATLQVKIRGLNKEL